MKKGIVFGTIGTAVVAGLAGFVLLRQSPDDRAATMQTARIQRGDLVETAAASGTITPDVQVEVKSRASGEVIDLAVKPGDRVEEGKLLVRLDPIDEERAVRESRASLSAARARVSQAKASLTIARAEAQEAQASYEVRKKGFAKGLISAEEHRTAENAAAVAVNTVSLREADVLAAQSDVDRARLAIAEAERRLEETTIKAPITGTVLSVLVEKGTIISSGITNVGGGTALLTLADLSKLYAMGALDEANVGKVRAGQEVIIIVDAYPQRKFRGKVERVSPLGVNTTNIVTFDVEVVVVDDEAYLLKPGMSADLEIIISRFKDVLLMPVAAVRSKEGQHFALLPSGREVKIRTGETDGNQIVVLDGLKEKDEVVVAGMESKLKQEGPRGLFGPRRSK